MPSLLSRISGHFRKRRMRRFLEVCTVTPATRILDVGGGPAIWRWIPEPQRPQIVYLNMPRAAEAVDVPGTVIFGDACRLPLADRSFDIVFSNSVIEHVGDIAAQQHFANEVRRVGSAYWIQTPNYFFPIEQHLWTPCIHWLPALWQRILVPRFTLWGLVTRADKAQRDFFFRHFLEDVRLLRKSELHRLFPDATIESERLAGLTKSWFIYRKG